MPSQAFVHLGARSEFSVGESLARVEDLCREAARHGQAAVALTDVDTLAGAVRFQEAARRAGLRPVLGVDLSVQPFQAGLGRGVTRVRLLAETAVGWRRLVTLVSQVRHPESGEVRGVPFDTLVQHARGLFLLVGGKNGELTRLLLARDFDAAEAYVERLRAAWPADRLYVELPDPIGPDAELARLLARAAEFFSLPAVAVPRVDCATASDDIAARYLDCARIGKLPARMDDLAVPVLERRHLADTPTVAERYALYPEALANAVAIAAACEASAPVAERRFPVFDYTRGVDAESFIWNEAFERAAARYGDRPTAYKERLNREFQEIRDANLQHALVALTKLDEELAARGVRRGPGAGVFTNSLVASLLGVSGVDPVLFDLPFRIPESMQASFPPIECNVPSSQDALALDALRALFGGQVCAVGRWMPWRPQTAVEHVTAAIGRNPRDRAALWKDVGFQGILEGAVAAPWPEGTATDSPEAIAWVSARLDGLARKLAAVPGLYAFAVESLSLTIPTRTVEDMPARLAVAEWTEGEIARQRYGMAALRNPPLVDLVSLAAREAPIPPGALRADDPAPLRILREGNTNGIEPLESPAVRRELRRHAAEDLVGLAALANTPIARTHEIDLPTVLLSFEAAWLKANRPASFYAAALGSAGADTRRLAALLAEVHARGIAVLPLDVNCSSRDWTVEGRAIRPGLLAVRDLSAPAIEELLHVRRELAYSDLADLLRRTDPARLRPRHLQALIRSGALDSFGQPRAAQLAALGRLLPLLRPSKARGGQEDLFAGLESSGDFFMEAQTAADAARTAAELVEAERTATGGVLLRVPPVLDRFLEDARAVRTRELSPKDAGRRICLAGRVDSFEPDPEAPGALLLEIDGCLVRVRESESRIVHAAAQSGRECLFVGVAARVGKHWEFVAENVAALDSAKAAAAQAKVLILDPAAISDEMMRQLLPVVKRFPGPTPLRLATEGTPVARKVEARRVVVCPLLEAELRALIGPVAWRVEAAGTDTPPQPLASGPSRFVRRMFETIAARR